MWSVAAQAFGTTRCGCWRRSSQARRSTCGYESAHGSRSHRRREVTFGGPALDEYQRGDAVPRGKYAAKLLSAMRSRSSKGVVVHPCKTVGVVLRWCESITRHHPRTTSVLGNSAALCLLKLDCSDPAADGPAPAPASRAGAVPEALLDVVSQGDSHRLAEATTGRGVVSLKRPRPRGRTADRPGTSTVHQRGALLSATRETQVSLDS